MSDTSHETNYRNFKGLVLNGKGKLLKKISYPSNAKTFGLYTKQCDHWEGHADGAVIQKSLFRLLSDPVRTCLGEGCEEVFVLVKIFAPLTKHVVCQCDITDVFMSNHHGSTCTPAAPITHTRHQQGGLWDHMFHFSQELWEIWKMWCGCHSLTPFMSCHPTQCLLEKSLMCFNQGSLEDAFWLRCTLGTLPSPCGVFSCEHWAWQEIGREWVWVAGSINQGVVVLCSSLCLKRSRHCDVKRTEGKQSKHKTSWCLLWWKD